MIWSARRACGMSRWPAGVIVTPRADRLKSCRPVPRSNAAIRFDTDGCARPRALAARPKLWCSAAARNTRKSSKSMVIAKPYDTSSDQVASAVTEEGRECISMKTTYWQSAADDEAMQDE